MHWAVLTRPMILLLSLKTAVSTGCSPPAMVSTALTQPICIIGLPVLKQCLLPVHGHPGSTAQCLVLPELSGRRIAFIGMGNIICITPAPLLVHPFQPLAWQQVQRLIKAPLPMYVPTRGK